MISLLEITLFVEHVLWEPKWKNVPIASTDFNVFVWKYFAGGDLRVTEVRNRPFLIHIDKFVRMYTEKH